VHPNFPRAISMFRRSRYFFVHSFPRSMCTRTFLVLFPCSGVHAISLCVVFPGRCAPALSSCYFHVAAFTLSFFVGSVPRSDVSHFSIFFDLLIGLEVSEYVAYLGIILWGLEQ
jgi:tellurite resistance protein TehA-like permease